MVFDGEQNITTNQDSEDELDWEEVEVPEQQHLEITIPTSSSRSKADLVNKSVSFLTLRVHLPDCFLGRRAYLTRSGSSELIVIRSTPSHCLEMRGSATNG